MDNRRGKDRWTARFVLRIAGAVALAVVALMALLGAFVIDFAASPKLFFYYWSAFFVLLMSAIIIAVFDAIATIGRFRTEHARLHRKFKQQMRDSGDAEP